MARIKIETPGAFDFSTEIAVRASDVNYGGHVGNDAVLTLVQEARIIYYKSIGFESEMKLDGNVGQIISDAAVVYQSESFYGDVLVISIAAGPIEKYGFDLFYRITNKATGKQVATVKTGIVCFDYATRKVCPVPDNVRRKLSKPE